MTGQSPLWPEYLVLFLLGSMIGSFLNVVICRIPAGKSIVWPGSHCPKCNHAIKPWENIPILSFIFLRGKCSGCKTSISFQYPIVEALMGGILALLLWKFGWTWDLLIYGTMAGFLVALSGIDIATMRLPNVLTLWGSIVAVVLTLLFKRDDWLKMLLGGGEGLGILILMGMIGRLLFGKETLGMGDIKLAGMMGLYLGPAATAGMFAFGVFSGSLIGGLLLIIAGRGWGQKIPFGPYLALGGIMALLCGREVWLWYVNLALR